MLDPKPPVGSGRAHNHAPGQESTQDAGAKHAPHPDYHFQRQGRSLSLVLALLCWILALAALGLVLEAAGWIILIFALPALPATWDLWRNPSSGLVLEGDQITWFTGTARNSLALQDIQLLRLDRRWDFSFRATLILRSGGKIRLPQSALPPVDPFEQKMQDRGVTSERHHFTVF
ncbi:hypothetical protein PH5382_00323 [Phaeobacter sp. CECT 5382]|uniref:hypothetical protein n=1 Tax=Phaeobacter sp. CECT 5382 TaxID=1712645 RepID=UPI0006DA9D1D|nr:hypothetical protein [Phaeobacter sp. CECT 5382]CUH86414.1 hypothetical protein PH5382_00323 [Phaeobacter sp. CECT 5382]